jgi:hypothetical protein
MAKRKRAAKKATAGRKRAVAKRARKTAKKAARPAAAKRLKKAAKKTAKTSKRAGSKTATRKSSAKKAAARVAKRVKKTARPAPAAKRKAAGKPKTAAPAAKARAAVKTPARKTSSRPKHAARPAPVRGAIPSSLNLPRKPSAARSGHEDLVNQLHGSKEVGPAITAGDLDANWEVAYSSGDEAPGGDNPTPDQDVVDDIGRALGIEYNPNEELKGAAKLEERDKHRWELDPASAEDYPDHDK